MPRKYAPKDTEYIVYKGEEHVFTGTRNACIDFLGIKRETFNYYISNKYAERLAARKNTRDATTIERIEDD